CGGRDTLAQAMGGKQKGRTPARPPCRSKSSRLLNRDSNGRTTRRDDAADVVRLAVVARRGERATAAAEPGLVVVHTVVREAYRPRSLSLHADVVRVDHAVLDGERARVDRAQGDGPVVRKGRAGDRCLAHISLEAGRESEDPHVLENQC